MQMLRHSHQRNVSGRSSKPPTRARRSTSFPPISLFIPFSEQSPFLLFLRAPTMSHPPLPSPSLSTLASPTLPLSPFASSPSPALSAASLSTNPSSIGSPPLCLSPDVDPPRSGWLWRKSTPAAAASTASLHDGLAIASPTSPAFPRSGSASASPVSPTFPPGAGARTATIKDKVLRSLGRSAQSLRARSNSLTKSRRPGSRPGTPPPELPRASQDGVPPVPVLPQDLRLPDSPDLVRMPMKHSSGGKPGARPSTASSYVTPPRTSSRPWQQEGGLSPSQEVARAFQLSQELLAETPSAANLDSSSTPTPPRLTPSESSATLLITNPPAADVALPVRTSSFNNPGSPAHAASPPQALADAGLETPPGSPTRDLINAWEARKTPPANRVRSPQRIIFPASPTTPRRKRTPRSATCDSREPAIILPSACSSPTKPGIPSLRDTQDASTPVDTHDLPLLLQDAPLTLSFPTPPKRHSATPQNPPAACIGTATEMDLLADLDLDLFEGLTPDLPQPGLFDGIPMQPDNISPALYQRAQRRERAADQDACIRPSCLCPRSFDEKDPADFGSMAMEVFEQEIERFGQATEVQEGEEEEGEEEEEEAGGAQGSWFDDDSFFGAGAGERSDELLLDALEAMCLSNGEVAKQGRCY